MQLEVSWNSMIALVVAAMNALRSIDHIDTNRLGSSYIEDKDPPIRTYLVHCELHRLACHR